MKEQKIIWTALPNGLGKTDTNKECLKLSVFVSPRLNPDNPQKLCLDEFPDFLDWTKKVKSVKFDVIFDNGTTFSTAPDTSQLDPKLWSALFKKDTFVRPYEFKDLKDRNIRTYPVQGVLSYLKKNYVSIAEKSPDNLPLLQPERDDEGNPTDEPNLASFIDNLGDLLDPEKEVICKVSDKKLYDTFIEGGDDDAVLEQILPYIMECLRKRKYPLFYDYPKIFKVDEYRWKITDGEIEYYLENTGKELNLYRYSNIYSWLDEELKNSKVLNPTQTYGKKEEQLNFLQANRFYDRREMESPYYFKPNAKMVPPPPEVEKIDFHQMLATLGDHPLLMRKLGLVLDLTIFPIPENTFTSLRLAPNIPLSSINKNLRPWTKCTFHDDKFMATSKPGSKIDNGMLDIADADDEHNGSSSVYKLIQVDPDGAALKTLNSASTMKRQIQKKYLFRLPTDIVKNCDLTNSKFNSYLKEFFERKDVSYSEYELSNDAKISKLSGNKWIINDRNAVYQIENTGKKALVFKKGNVAYDTPEDAGLTSLRSAGIALTKSGRAFNLNKHFVIAQDKNNILEMNDDNQPVDLYADDLLRGYRVDMLDEKISEPEWRSLCQRIGNYTLPDSGIDSIPVDDEGYVKGASATSKDKENSDLYLHETVFRWDGWSLCAQRPGKTIVSETREEGSEVLFNLKNIWDEATVENEQFINFLEKYLDIRWARGASITMPDNNTREINDSNNTITLSLEGTNILKLKTDDDKEYSYDIKDENSDQNVYTTILMQDEKPDLVKNKAATDFKLESNFSAKPGTLPQLRFGHSYRLRARTVDISGNSVSGDSKDSSNSSKSLYYSRFEPLIPPVIVPRKEFTEGESVERMVIRSNFDKTSTEYINSLDDALSDENYTYEEGNERHVVPPKTSQLMAETHGMFDDYFGEGKDYQKGYNIALKEKEILNDSNQEEKIEILYLPDPIGRGTAFRNLPGLTSNGTVELEKIIDSGLNLKLIKIPFKLEWPNADSFRIRIEERPGKMEKDKCVETFDNFEDPPKWDVDKQLLTVYLAKAEATTVRYSCYMDEDDVKLMGIWKWLGNSSTNGTFMKYALAGSHWMVTPYRELVLVHAVQQPLCEPTIQKQYAIKKKVGDTFASIKGELHLSVKSTGKIDLLAHWTEPLDDLAQDEPSTIDKNSYAFEIKIDESFNNKLILPIEPCVDHLHEFGDTKYRHVKYYLNGATCFREYFHRVNINESINEYCFNWDEVPGNDSQRIIDFLKDKRNLDYTGSAIIEKSIDGQTVTITENSISVSLKLNNDKNALILLEDGKEYVYAVNEGTEEKLCIEVDKISRRGAVHEVDVLNSARPAAPKVEYIIPTFGWEEKQEPKDAKMWNKFERKRIGGGLRVYLNRPWYSSGDGELLGVTLYSHLIPDVLKPYVTQWGMDPIRRSNIPKGILTKNDFANVEQGQKGLTLEELINQNVKKVDVAGFKVEYNKKRKLWYCDVQFDSNKVKSYYPFVRLALTRYQPNSISNAHLSRVVLSDFVQLANDRTLNIAFSDDKHFYISVNGYGTADRSSNRIEVSIETLPKDGHEEFDWIPIKGTKIQPNPYSLHLHPIDVKKYLWMWDAKMRLPKSRGNENFRIVVREYEKFEEDNENILPIIMIHPNMYKKETERLVYFDIVNVSSKVK